MFRLSSVAIRASTSSDGIRRSCSMSLMYEGARSILPASPRSDNLCSIRASWICSPSDLFAGELVMAAHERTRKSLHLLDFGEKLLMPRRRDIVRLSANTRSRVRLAAWRNRERQYRLWRTKQSARILANMRLKSYARKRYSLKLKASVSGLLRRSWRTKPIVLMKSNAKFTSRWMESTLRLKSEF